MKKKLISGLLFAGFIFSIFVPSSFAANKSFYFNVTPSNNNGTAFSAANPKDDNEQAAYIYTTNHNIIDSDLFYYNVRTYNSIEAPSKTGYFRVTPSNASRIVKGYTGADVTKGQYLWLEANTDKYGVSASGYWYS